MLRKNESVPLFLYVYMQCKEKSNYKLIIIFALCYLVTLKNSGLFFSMVLAIFCCGIFLILIIEKLDNYTDLKKVFVYGRHNSMRSNAYVSNRV